MDFKKEVLELSEQLQAENTHIIDSLQNKINGHKIREERIALVLAEI